MLPWLAPFVLGGLLCGWLALWGRAELKRYRQRRRTQLAEQARQHRADTLPGFSAKAPIAVAAPSVVEVRAKKSPCVNCGAPMVEILGQHRAQIVQGQRLRIATVRCDLCKASFELFFTLDPSLAAERS